MASIINDKYKGKKFEKDWLATLLDENASGTKTKKVKEKNPENPDETITKEVTVPHGVDGTKLLALARENGLNVDALAADEGKHGWAGRARMTIRNMLQTVAKQRHGLVIGGEFVTAPTDWLQSEKVKAPAAPTHSETGEKFVVAKVEEKEKADA